MSTSLYRIYSRGNLLLYVGISNATLRRIDNEHRRRKSWWGRVGSIAVEHFDDREAALRAEKKAIESEHPQYNVVHVARSSRTMPPKPSGKVGKKRGWHNAAKTHCPQGHPLEGENIYWHDGKRHCRLCRKDAARRATH